MGGGGGCCKLAGKLEVGLQSIKCKTVNRKKSGGGGGLVATTPNPFRRRGLRKFRGVSDFKKRQINDTK